MSANEGLTTAFDAPWKAALEYFLDEFLALCFPPVHALIDWTVAPVFLETELQQLAPQRHEPRRTVDKLVQVRLKDGREEWLLIQVISGDRVADAVAGGMGIAVLGAVK